MREFRYQVPESSALNTIDRTQISGQLNHEAIQRLTKITIERYLHGTRFNQHDWPPRVVDT
jgi:hypothetical protein